MKKKILCSLLAIMMLFSLASCGIGKKDSNDLSTKSKSELLTIANSYSEQIVSQQSQINQLQDLLSSLQDNKGGSTAAISTMNDGSNKLTFNSFNNRIVLPVPFEYPNSNQAPAASSISITKNITVAPTNNWECILDGATLELYHTSGISGIIKAGTINSTFDKSKLQSTVFTTFFNDFPQSTISYSNIFLDTDWWGVQATTSTTINDAAAYIRCGMVGFSSECFTYMFVYTGNQDNTKDELEATLLKTMTMYGRSLRIE